jgi:hypothetical protein
VHSSNGETHKANRPSIVDRQSSSDKKDLREAGENIRKAREGDETPTPVDQKRTGNKPRFDRDR